MYLVIVGASLSEPHSYMESSAVLHALRTVMKNEIATHCCSFGTCINKHDKLMDTSIQVHRNAKILASFTDIPY